MKAAMPDGVLGTRLPPWDAAGRQTNGQTKRRAENSGQGCVTHQGDASWCAQALLKAGADPKTYDQALASACEYARWPCSADDGHVACVHALLQAGADPSCGLMAACACGHEALAQVLLQAGADPRQGQR